MSDTVSEKELAQSPSGGKRRQVRPKAERRQQLIDATIRCIAQQGLSAVTLQMVTREAGLSLGIANLHFQSKDNLLRETLRFVAEEYHGGQIRIMEGTAIANLGWKEIKLPAPVFPGDTLYANTEVLDKRESKSRPNAGIVSVLTRGINQDDTEVCVFERQILIPKRHVA